MAAEVGKHKIMDGARCTLTRREELTTVKSCDAASEYPIARMIEGKKRENEERGVAIPTYALEIISKAKPKTTAMPRTPTKPAPRSSNP